MGDEQQGQQVAATSAAAGGLSKTQVVSIAAAVTAVLPFIPGVGPAISAAAAANPQATVAILSALGAGLHYLLTFVTHKDKA